ETGSKTQAGAAEEGISQTCSSVIQQAIAEASRARAAGRPASDQERSRRHAEDEVEEGRRQALQSARQRQYQALARLHAPHPHEEEHQAQAPPARHHRGGHSNKRQVLAMLPYSK